MKKVKFLTQAGIIAAVYAVLTIVIPLSSGPVQVRVSEMLTVLPYYTPAAVYGLTAGCLIANIFAGNGPLDVVFGSLATLIAALLTSKAPKRVLAPLPPVVANAVIIPIVLKLALGAPFFLTVLTIAAGQLAACYGLGYPLMLLLERYGIKRGALSGGGKG